jgi:iron complex transport system ATP-binding protein
MILKTKNLSFAYGKDQILYNINLNVNQGDCLVILGNNGAGKSTLIKCLNNILQPQDGSIILNDKAIKHYTKKDIAKLIAYVPQDIEFYNETVFNSVLLGRKPYMHFQTHHSDLIKTNQILKDLGIDHLALKNVCKLSGGQRQKVAFARALNQETPILLLDEPTANLDLKNQLMLVNLMKKIAKQNNKTLIVTMHDINLALRFANKFIFIKEKSIYKMGDQKIITKGLIKDIYDIDIEIVHHNRDKHIINI